MTSVPSMTSGQLRVEDRRVRGLDDVRRDDRVLGVARGCPRRPPVSACALNASLISSTVVSRASLDGEVDDRAGRHGRADREAVQLALELGQHEADGLGGAGRGRDQVDRGGAGAAQVLVRHVLQALVGRVGVDRRHQAVLDADRLVQHLRDRREAVRRARRVGDDVVLVGVVGVVEVDAERDRDVRLGGRRGDDHLLRARRRGASAASSRLVKRPVDSITTSAPRSPHGSAAGSRSARTLISLPSTTSASSVCLDRARVRAEDRVVLQQVRERLGVGRGR